MLTLPWSQYFETRRSTLDSFEAQLRSLLSALSNAAKVRSSLQTSLGELQTSLLVLSQCDLSTSLRGALEQAAGVQRRLRELGEQQSISEEQIGGITSVTEGYARLCGSVKVSSSTLPPPSQSLMKLATQLVFGARVKSYHSWQAAESVLRKMRSAHEKAKKSGRTHSELLGLSLSEISDVSLIRLRSLLRDLLTRTCDARLSEEVSMRSRTLKTSASSRGLRWRASTRRR